MLAFVGESPVNTQLGEVSDLAASMSLLLYTVIFLLFGGWMAANQRALAHAEQTPERVGVGAGSARTVNSPDTEHLSPDAPRRRGGVAGIAIALLIVTCLIHLGAVVLRAVATARAPWGNMYEFTLTGTALLGLACLAVLLRPALLGVPHVRQTAWLGVFIAGINVVSLSMALKFWHVPAAQLVPALQEELWLRIHVFTAIAATVMSTLGFVFSVLFLLTSDSVKSSAMQRMRALLPARESLELAAHRCYTVAFPLWTIVLITGAIWAQRAWGRYWNWDPKEVWTFVTWVLYAAYLHARATGGWQRKATWVAVAAFASILFNFVIVNLFASGLHSYGGVG